MKATVLFAALVFATPVSAACLTPPCDYAGEWMPGDPFDSSYLPEVPYDPADEPVYDDMASTWTYPDGTVVYAGDAGYAGSVTLAAASDEPTPPADNGLQPKGVLFPGLRLRDLIGIGE